MLKTQSRGATNHRPPHGIKEIEIDPVQGLGVAYAIQAANWRDLMALRRLEVTCFGEDAWPLVDLLAVLSLPNVVRLKAVAGEQMIGFVSGDLRPRERLGWITTIGVLPEYRRMGVASTLLDRCEALLEMPAVRLCVRKSNAGAIRLYAQRGYRYVTVWARYYSGGEDALVMEKTLGAGPTS